MLPPPDPKSGGHRLHRRGDHHDVRLDPQQDVFQRVQSAKSEKIAVWGSVLGGSLYFCSPSCRCSWPIRPTLIDPEMVAR